MRGGWHAGDAHAPSVRGVLPFHGSLLHDALLLPCDAVLRAHDVQQPCGGAVRFLSP